MGMLDELPGVPGGYVWNDRVFDAADVALCGALIHHDATPAQLDITAGWLVWGTYADDYFPIVFGRARDLIGAKALVDRLSVFMPLDPEPVPPPMNPVERGLADLWSRTAGPMSRFARTAFRTAIEDMIESWVWEIVNQIQNRIPDPIDYIEMRRQTFGSELTMSLSRLTRYEALPPSLFQTRAVRGIECCAMDYGCLTNDLYSYQKEVEFEGELHNGVLVVQRFLDCDAPAAARVVSDLMTARMQQLEHIVATELPVLVEEQRLTPRAREQLRQYVEGLQLWMAGVLRWHASVDRYKESELRRGRMAAIEPGRMQGLGTAAMRVAGSYRAR
jgi:germacradienol/geosmin synthase